MGIGFISVDFAGVSLFEFNDGPGLRVCLGGVCICMHTCIIYAPTYVPTYVHVHMCVVYVYVYIVSRNVARLLIV